MIKYFYEILYIVKIFQMTKLNETSCTYYIKKKKEKKRKRKRKKKRKK